MPEFLVQLFYTLLEYAYVSVGVITAIGYLPTIIDLWFRKKLSANISSYVLWTITSTIALAYVCFINKDLNVLFVSIVHFVCCALILILAIKRSRQKLQ